MGFNPNGILHQMFFAHALIWNENGNFSMFRIDSAWETTLSIICPTSHVLGGLPFNQLTGSNQHAPNMHQHAPTCTKFAHVSAAHKTLLRPPNCCVRELEGWGSFNYRLGASGQLSPWAMVEIHVILDPIRFNLHRMFHHAPCLVWSPPSIWKVGQMTPRRSFQR